MKDFVLIMDEYGDWEGLYQNNKLVSEGHNITTEDVVKSLKQGYDNFSVYGTKGGWLTEQGSLPTNLDDAVNFGIVLYWSL